MALSSISVMANSLRLRGKGRPIAERAGNTYVKPTTGLAHNRMMAGAFSIAILVVVVPFATFTAIDRGWVGDGNDASEQHEPGHETD